MFNTDVADTRCKALYRAVLETPADDTIRLILADALDERGMGDDAERAWYIRTCVNGNRDVTIAMDNRLAVMDVLGEYELEWRRIGKCWVCHGTCKVVYGLEETEVDCVTCGSTGWDGVLHERVAGIWDEQSGRPWAEFNIPFVWSRGFISGVRVPLGVFMSYEEPQWVRRLFLQWPIQSVTIEDAEPGDNSRVAAMHEEYTEYRWYSGEFGHDITRGYIPKPLFDIIKQHTLMTPGREGALRALDMACVIWGRERAGLPFVDPRDWVRHS